MDVNNVLQTLKHRLNRSAAFPLTSKQIQDLNGLIDLVVVGGEILEDAAIQAALSPVEAVVATTEEPSFDEQEIFISSQQLAAEDVVAGIETPVVGEPMTNEEVQAGIDSGSLVPVEGTDTHFTTPEVTTENTILEEAANVEPTPDPGQS